VLHRWTPLPYRRSNAATWAEWQAIPEEAASPAVEPSPAAEQAGYASEYEMEHLIHPEFPMTVYVGTSEIQREIIGEGPSGL
jgi:hypothetical protein